ncbi:hypothetical protein [Candidatus Erwinia dacicola]|uniref:Uncharacterized protein n=1 Tax=Candidatus Erwinia dacicola TaxID=252393 RepID=A0A328TP96_9GAMM|nr:hypothetical protein [Candidatus Erwinia dacicola]RAP72040.1 hypothetical protein ACZ87_01131 [Candidatus Erwinia dacicola]
MKHNDTAEQLTAAMKQKQDGYELDGCDWHRIRTTVSKAIASQRHSEDRARSSSSTFTWRKPVPCKRC